MVNTQGRVGPQHRRRRRRKFSNESASDSDSAGETDTEAARNAVVMDPKCKTRTTKEDDLSFAERRQLQRNAAAEKRRLKMKCHLCGKVGHVRRECPGIDDDGRGESKYTKSHGDTGSTVLTPQQHKKAIKKTKTPHRGGRLPPSRARRYEDNAEAIQKDDGNEDTNTTTTYLRVALPPGFEKVRVGATSSDKEEEEGEQEADTREDAEKLDEDSNNTKLAASPVPPAFHYFDAGGACESDVVDYLLQGRGNHKQKKMKTKTKKKKKNTTKKHNTAAATAGQDAREEYDRVMKQVVQTSNFGGAITRHFVDSSDGEEDHEPSILRGLQEDCAVTNRASSTPFASTPAANAAAPPPLFATVIGVGSNCDRLLRRTPPDANDDTGEGANSNTATIVYEDTAINPEVVDLLTTKFQQFGNSVPHRPPRVVVGMFADLDYSDTGLHTYVGTTPPPNEHHRHTRLCEEQSHNNHNTNNNSPQKNARSVQLQRLRCTVRAACALRCPVQIRLGPSASSKPRPGAQIEEVFEEKNKDPYLEAIRDLGKILLEAKDYCAPRRNTGVHQDSSEPIGADDSECIVHENNHNDELSLSSSSSSVGSLKVHVSCWNGKSEHMLALLHAFPEEVYFGFDATVTFSKATQLHECAFDVPLARLLLETGAPAIIPSIVTKTVDSKHVFGHAGYIPFIAASMAHYAAKNSQNSRYLAMHTRGTATANDDDGITAEVIARAAAVNTQLLYGISF